MGAGIDVDGDFGQATHRATQDFQRSEGLQPDGIVGPLTGGAMQRHYQPVEQDQQGPFHPSTHGAYDRNAHGDFHPELHGQFHPRGASKSFLQVSARTCALKGRVRGGGDATNDAFVALGDAVGQFGRSSGPWWLRDVPKGAFVS
jgi:hypothetical protein